MNIIGSIETIFRKYVPSPFTIAILLTITTIFLALIFTVPEEISSVDYLIDILTFWEKGIWSTSLLEFAYQMMLILVLGHVLVRVEFMPYQQRHFLVKQTSLFQKDYDGILY